MGIQQIRRREKVEEEGEKGGEEEKQKQKEIINRRIENFDPQRYLEATTTTATHTMICILLISVCIIHHSSFIIYYILFIGVFHIYLCTFETGRLTWEKKEPEKDEVWPSPRYHHSATLVGSSLYIFGGSIDVSPSPFSSSPFSLSLLFLHFPLPLLSCVFKDALTIW